MHILLLHTLKSLIPTTILPYKAFVLLACQSVRLG